MFVLWKALEPGSTSIVFGHEIFVFTKIDLVVKLLTGDWLINDIALVKIVLSILLVTVVLYLGDSDIIGSSEDSVPIIIVTNKTTTITIGLSNTITSTTTTTTTTTTLVSYIKGVPITYWTLLRYEGE